MKKPKKQQGKIKNKLIIMWDKDSAFNVKNNVKCVDRDSFKCDNLKSAEKIIDKRKGENMQFAKFYDSKGEVTALALPKKKQPKII